MKIISQIKKQIADNKKYHFSNREKQTVILYSSHMMLLFLGVGITSLNTRILGPDGYGIFALFIAITGFTVVFFRFGFFSSGGLILAQEKNKAKESELIGTLLIVCFIIGIGFSLCIFIISFFVDQLFETNVSNILQLFSPLLIILPFQMMMPEICRGTNKIKNLAWFNVIPRALYFIFLVSLLVLGFAKLNVYSLIFLNLISVIIGVIILSYSFKPVFKELKKNFQRLWQKNMEYGFYVYLGQVANQSTYKLDSILIGYFVNATQLGFYSLATVITVPMVRLSQSLSMSLFKDYAHSEEIPKKVVYVNCIWLLFNVIALVTFRHLIIEVLFTEKFLPVASLILPMSLAAFFQGMYQPYSFLAAKGKGKWIRNVAYAEASINLFGNLVLIYYYGAMGAAIASAVSKFVHWMMLRRYYAKYIKNHKS